MNLLLDHLGAELGRAWDRVVALGWPSSRLELRVGTTDSYGMPGRVSLVVRRAEAGELDRYVFETTVSLRGGDELWIASRWLGLDEMKEDLDAVDRVALARMFPHWDAWSDARAVKGTIRRAA